jgi:hypothetical protein
MSSVVTCCSASRKRHQRAMRHREVLVLRYPRSFSKEMGVGWVEGFGHEKP